MEPVQIDGSIGEGGGQIFRTSLTLSMITGRPVHIINIRANRPKGGGLKKQHLVALRAAKEISSAEVLGDELGSTMVAFTPGEIKGGEYRFEIDSAGSTTLVLQTVLLPLMLADSPSKVTVTGGTHNTFAPPFEYLEKVFLPVLERMGVTASVKLNRHGFYPEGGGEIEAEITPGEISPIEISGRLRVRLIKGYSKIANVPPYIAQKQLDTINRGLPVKTKNLHTDVCEAPAPGNAVMIEIESPELVEMFTSFGESKVRPDKVAKKAVNEAKKYIKTRALVGPHLADQLIIPFSLAGGGFFETGALSSHTKTNIEITKMFLDVDILCEEQKGGVIKVAFAKKA